VVLVRVLVLPARGGPGLRRLERFLRRCCRWCWCWCGCWCWQEEAQG
jgi:hypothetical protein